MEHTTVIWNWIYPSLYLRAASTIPSGTLLVMVVDLLALVFLVIGVLSFLRIWWLRRQKNGDTSELSPGRVQMIRRQNLRWSLVPSLALLIPVILLLFAWGNAVFPSDFFRQTSTPIPTSHPTVITLRVGTSVTFPEQVSIDPGTKMLSGFDIDLINAIAQQLHDNITIDTMDFGQLINSLNSKKVDVVIAAYALTSQVTSLQTIPYLAPHEVVLALKNTTATNKVTKFTMLTDLCGHTIGVLQSSKEDTDLHNTKCDQKSPLKIVEEPDVNAVENALISGQLDATYQDSPSSDYFQQMNQGKLQVVGSHPGVEEGILVRADNVSLFQEIQTAFQQLIQNDTYSQLLSKWNLSNDTISSSGT